MFYLVCFVRNDRNRWLWILEQMAHSIRGPIYHIEPVFYQDFYGDSLLVSGKCKDGYPVIVEQRRFGNKKAHYDLHWYEFQDLTYELEYQIRDEAEKMIASKEYRVSMTEMIGSSVSRVMRPFFEQFMFWMHASREKFVMDYEKSKPVFCASMVSILLNKVLFKEKPLPTNLPSTDLILTLERRGVLTKCKHAPVLRNEDDIPKKISMMTVAEKDRIARAEKEDDYIM